MKTLCEISGNTYRAAFACMAKKDVRYYLNGILLSAKHGELCATDGSMLYVDTIEQVDMDTDIVFEPVKLPANVDRVEIQSFQNDTVLVLAHDKRGKTSQHICKIIDGWHPDYKTVTGRKVESEPCNEIGLGLGYLAKLKQVFPGPTVKLVMTRPTNAVTITSPDCTGVITLMPVRL